MRYLKILPVLLGMMCLTQIYINKKVVMLTQVEDWPYGIRFARWDNQTEVDWNWLKILEPILTPGRRGLLGCYNDPYLL